MSDPTDFVLPVVGAGGAGALIMKLLTWSGNRNISSLDTTIKSLTETIAKLAEEVQKLREAHIGLAKDVGALQEGQRRITERIDGQAAFYHKQFEEHRAMVHERMAKATHDMLATVEQVTENFTNKRKGR